MTIVALSREHTDALIEFFGRLPAEDLTLMREDVTEPDAVRGWADRPAHWVALDDTAVVGFTAVRPLPSWSDHVGELRLVVDSAHRRAGIGGTLARHALTDAVRAGRRKVVVELAADQEHALAMFGSLGFEGEALLRDHIRDRQGNLRDLIMLAHFVDATWASMDTIGVSAELGLEGSAQ
ncbi:GNAT family N-acetyltransferase [Rhodococcus sp. A14]|uniref:GNAT family N-acetyltransferase n=1 Tax=Rhodococcus sp. A14 TaxID=1194106 RepID=UPI00141EBEA7|nr:GNAT family N-acetyltransferase [Rhodococcus sp. A14]